MQLLQPQHENCILRALHALLSMCLRVKHIVWMLRDTEVVKVPKWAEHAIFYAIYPLGAYGAPFTNDCESEPVCASCPCASCPLVASHLPGWGIRAVPSGLSQQALLDFVSCP